MDNKTDKSELDKTKDPKKAKEKKDPKAIPTPPKLGVFLMWELLSFGLAVKFFMTLT